MATVVTDSGSSYDLTVEGVVVGRADYRLRAGRIVFTHTGIDPAHEGEGLGSVLAREALADVRRRGLKVVPLCPFIKAWIERHPDAQDLVTT